MIHTQYTEFLPFSSHLEHGPYHKDMTAERTIPSHLHSAPTLIRLDRSLASLYNFRRGTAGVFP